MTRVEFAGGSYAEAWPGGRYGVLVGTVVRTDAGDLPSAPEPPLHLRGDGQGRFVGQGHQTGRIVLWTGQAWKPHGATCGVNACIFLPDGSLKVNDACQDGTQGYRFVEGGKVWTGDETYNGAAINGLAEWTQHGDVTIGQSYVDGCAVRYHGVRRVLERGHCTFIRFNRVGDDCAVALWKQQENRAVLFWFGVAEIDALPLEIAPQPHPEPQPDPDPEPEPAMQLPDAVKAIRARYVAKFPIPQTPGGGDAHEERCRQWSIRLAEQVAFERAGEGWGMKRADMGRPISKDTIARQMDGKLWIWDLLVGTGTGTPSLAENPQGEEITGQVFVAVRPTNHLADTPIPEPTPHPEPQPNPSVDLSQVMAELTAIRAGQRELLDAISRIPLPPPVDLTPLLQRPWPIYEGSNRYLGTITLTPKRSQNESPVE